MKVFCAKQLTEVVKTIALLFSSHVHVDGASSWSVCFSELSLVFRRLELMVVEWR